MRSDHDIDRSQRDGHSQGCLRRSRIETDMNTVLAARSLLWLIGTLAVVAVLWLTLLAGGRGTPSTTNAPSGATSDYKTTIDAAQSAVERANEDAQRGSASSAP